MTEARENGQLTSLTKEKKNGISYLIFILFLRDELFSAYYVCGNSFISYAAKKNEQEEEAEAESRGGGSTSLPCECSG